jgi:hypothetical protein
MDLTFERGEAVKPKGHALVYFTDPGTPGQLWATYLIVLPITVDVTKYVPPFLMNQMGELGPKDLSAFAFPPSPEQIPGRQHLDELADLRDDDILNGGALPGGADDVAAAMFTVNEMLQSYSQLYSANAPAPTAAPGEPGEIEDSAGGAGVNEVLYGLMSDSDRLGELTKLIGRLRYAVDGSEDSLVRETEDEITVLVKHLPDGMQVPKMVEAVKASDARGAQLAALYLQRSYHLVKEAFSELGAVDREIEELEAES